MKIINVCADDHANFMYQIHKSLLSVGVDSYAYKLTPHPFNYEEQADIISVNLLNTLEADLILIHHSDWELQHHFKSDVGYYHTGTKFRQGKANIIPIVNKSLVNLIALPEFHNQGLANEFYLMGSTANPSGSKGVKHRFGHYPSNPHVKGTDTILKAFSELGINVDCKTERVDYKEQLERMQDAQVIVELFNPMLNGNFYGSFGMTALEAASYRKVVLTQNITGQELYRQTYGECELVICNTYQDLKNNILKYNTDDIYQKANDTYLWWSRNHSEYATGSRLADILNRVCR
jgi:hypothetical protein